MDCSKKQLIKNYTLDLSYFTLQHNILLLKLAIVFTVDRKLFWIAMVVLGVLANRLRSVL
jgi:hypothetical protein